MKYFENKEFIQAFRTDEMTRIFEDSESIHIIFEEPNDNIWIPKSIADAQELSEFVDCLERQKITRLESA